MKKATVGLIGTLLIIMLTSNAWAHSQSGFRISGGNGFGFSISDGYSGLSIFGHNVYRPYPYYSGYYSNRPYLGWGGYRRHQHHHSNYKHRGQYRSGHHHKGHHYGHQRGYKRGGYGQNHRNHQRRGHQARQWLR